LNVSSTETTEENTIKINYNKKMGRRK